MALPRLLVFLQIKESIDWHRSASKCLFGRESDGEKAKQKCTFWEDASVPSRVRRAAKATGHYFIRSNYWLSLVSLIMMHCLFLCVVCFTISFQNVQKGPLASTNPDAHTAIDSIWSLSQSPPVFVVNCLPAVLNFKKMPWFARLPLICKSSLFCCYKIFMKLLLPY